MSGQAGHLFQNRYKSILCQEETYFLELVRYIHLNPLRAKLVSGSSRLKTYPYSGHSAIMGKKDRPWQDTGAVLSRFGKQKAAARCKYHQYVEKGVALGRRSDPTGGGLVRSAGGWEAVKAMSKAKAFQKGDERLLGDGDFVQALLKDSQQQITRRYQIQAQGWDLDKVAERVAGILDINPADVWRKGRHQKTVRARSLLCYWAVHPWALLRPAWRSGWHISNGSWKIGGTWRGAY